MLTLARDLDAPERRTALLAHLPPQLRADSERAWRAFACSLLADALRED